MTFTAESPTIHPTQQLKTELANLTETTALAVAPLVGTGDRHAIDQAAVDALTSGLSASTIASYYVAMNEGVKDGAPHLPHGTVFGDPDAPLYDFAADPVEGTSRVASGRGGGMVLAAVAPHGTFPEWADIRYMRKFVVGSEAATNMHIGNYMSITNDPREVMTEVAVALGKRDRTQLRVAVLDRERNQHIIDAIEAIGATVIKLDSGDVLPALQVCLENGNVDMLYGSGGAPETILTAAAVAGLGGNMQAMWDPNPDGTAPEEIEAVDALDQRGMVLTLSHMIGNRPEDVVFAASGVTTSPLLKGPERKRDLWVPGDTLVTQGKPHPTTGH